MDFLDPVDIERLPPPPPEVYAEELKFHAAYDDEDDEEGEKFDFDSSDDIPEAERQLIETTGEVKLQEPPGK
ncbi:hypothetical protein GDO86_009924 [Hymenochirus boettgeri]|uniref:Uncharacterized protein n=1 Tax=Hymenochirus boettgeri TaxID=247094 RepID=A0A8T2JNF3_9PIPI|nr:hypothetical protein GDO86_009924 [Hymenochirus boettgeri]KAG8444947.1 hypothetical protein GDO86_009924 [Hymenochirus boettgeri]